MIYNTERVTERHRGCMGSFLKGAHAAKMLPYQAQPATLYHRCAYIIDAPFMSSCTATQVCNCCLGIQNLLLKHALPRAETLTPLVHGAA